MNKGVLLLLGFIAWFGLIIVAMPSFAQSQTDTPETTEAETEAETETGSTDPSSAAKSRIEARRAALATAIDQARKDRISGRCKGAQERLKARLTAANVTLENRKQMYGKLQARLDRLTARLDAGDVDTSQLSILDTQLDTLIADFLVDFNNYIVALTDASELDCASDTEGFVAAIEDARTQLKTSKEGAVSIRTLVLGDIKDALKDIKDTIKASNTEATAQ